MKRVVKIVGITALLLNVIACSSDPPAPVPKSTEGAATISAKGGFMKKSQLKQEVEEKSTEEKTTE